jgi:multiple antibiotic resistance protein
MFKIFEPFLLTFIPIFVAVDAIGNIPIFVSLVEGTGKKQRQKIIRDSVTTATVVAILFMFIGKWVLRAIGITISDFQIAGGILLFVISVRLLLPGTAKSVLADSHDKDIGVFPLGTPLITGPAVLTTTLMMLDSFGLAPTFVSLLLNMLIVWITLNKADSIMRIMGANGTRAFSKIMYILLAAIGVMMVRRGIMGVK